MLAVLLLHGLAALCAPAILKRTGRSGFYAVALVPLGSLIWLFTQTPRVYGESGEWYSTLEWIPQLGITLAFRMDALAYMMSLLILGVGALVLIYCALYFKSDADGIGAFAAQLVAFAGAMFGLVTADDLLVLFVFWEITSVLSFLLISYSRTKLAARRAALQALVITTAGGLAMLVGMIMLGEAAGTYRVSQIVDAAPELMATSATLNAAIILILAGAISKSALFPTHFWLPAAMAAPTPVSAYLHAAAMVKAGIYLVARFAPGFAATEWWLPVTVSLGLATMIFGAGWPAPVRPQTHPRLRHRESVGLHHRGHQFWFRGHGHGRHGHGHGPRSVQGHPVPVRGHHRPPGRNARHPQALGCGAQCSQVVRRFAHRCRVHGGCATAVRFRD